MGGYDRAHKLPGKIRRTPAISLQFTHPCDAIVQVPASNSVNQRKLVWKVLIQGADAHTGNVGNLVGVERGPAFFPQNASTRFNDSLDHGAGTRLARLLPHGRP